MSLLLKGKQLICKLFFSKPVIWTVSQPYWPGMTVVACLYWDIFWMQGCEDTILLFLKWRGINIHVDNKTGSSVKNYQKKDFDGYIGLIIGLILGIIVGEEFMTYTAASHQARPKLWDYLYSFVILLFRQSDFEVSCTYENGNNSCDLWKVDFFLHSDEGVSVRLWSAGSQSQVSSYFTHLYFCFTVCVYVCVCALCTVQCNSVPWDSFRLMSCSVWVLFLSRLTCLLHCGFGRW